MTARPHDALFKWAFEAPTDAAALLRALLPPTICQAIAWETLEDASASFIDLALADHHSDLLFAAKLRTGEPDLVYLLLEHQSTDDAAMPLRMLSYQTQIWARFRKDQPGASIPPILGVLVSHISGGWASARSFQQLLGENVMAIPGMADLVPRFSMIVEDLAARSDDDLWARSLGPFQKVALWLLRDSRDPVRLLDGFDAWTPTIMEAGQSRSGSDAMKVLIEYLFEVLDPVYFDLIRAKLRKLGTRSREIAMTIAEYLEEQGRTKGRAEGLMAALRRQLVYKFQALDAAAEARLQAATPEAIDRYLRRVLTADSLDAVFED
jgi:hypothetical protein